MTYWLTFELVDIQQNKLAIDRREQLLIEQNGYCQNIMAHHQKKQAIYRTEWLSIEQNGYQLNRMAIDRIECLLIEQNG